MAAKRLITRSFPTLTLVGPLGIPKGKYFQVYAPNQNENVYTNDWLGPFYGFERVIETFELTDAPYRLKPIDIYFHTYSASKPASLRALQKVFNWAMAQETTPVHVSDYVRKVLDFNSMVVARTADGWLVRGRGMCGNCARRCRSGSRVSECGQCGGRVQPSRRQPVSAPCRQCGQHPFRQVCACLALSGFRQCIRLAPELGCHRRRDYDGHGIERTSTFAVRSRPGCTLYGECRWPSAQGNFEGPWRYPFFHA